jgi:hypothetical protein
MLKGSQMSKLRSSGTRVSQFATIDRRRTQQRGLITFAILHESPSYHNNNGLEKSDNKASVKQHPPTQIPLNWEGLLPSNQRVNWSAFGKGKCTVKPASSSFWRSSRL